MEQVQFETEINQLLNLIIHSLYSDKDIFLRELISNASDAIDKLKFESLTNENLKSDNELSILIKTDDEKKALIIKDNGIGMTLEEVKTNLGTIAKSGTKEFINKIKEQGKDKDISLVGQFGVGFYSAFMVANKVEVFTKSAKSEKGVYWVSEGKNSFSVEEIDRSENGTEIIVYLNDDEQEYLQEYKIRSIVKKFSDFIEYPIYLEKKVESKKEDSEETETKIEKEKLNSQKPIWLKNKKDVTQEEYNEFYKYLTYDSNEPFEILHYRAEGVVEFNALLFFPKKPMSDLFNPEFKYGLSLYVNKVFITNKSENLLPKYFRFLYGVVECNDLPLNVSREMIQKSPVLDKIKTNITKKVLSTLQNMLNNEKERYIEFYKEFGTILKEGIHFDFANKDKIQELLMFQTNKSNGELITLKDYVSNMKDGQKNIYYITGDNTEELLNSPHLEIFKKNDYEVILMKDAIDEFIVDSIMEYDGKKLHSVNKGEIEELKNDEVAETKKVEFDDFIKYLKEDLKDKVKDVRISNRLVDSPCALVADEGDMSLRMEKILKSMNQDIPSQKKILEINIEHPVFNSMKSIYEKDSKNEVLKDYADLLYNQALIVEGNKPANPAEFVKKVTDIMAKALS